MAALIDRDTIPEKKEDKSSDKSVFKPSTPPEKKEELPISIPPGNTLTLKKEYPFAILFSFSWYEAVEVKILKSCCGYVSLSIVYRSKHPIGVWSHDHFVAKIAKLFAGSDMTCSYSNSRIIVEQSMHPKDLSHFLLTSTADKETVASILTVIEGIKDLPDLTPLSFPVSTSVYYQEYVRDLPITVEEHEVIMESSDEILAMFCDGKKSEILSMFGTRYPPPCKKKRRCSGVMIRGFVGPIGPPGRTRQSLLKTAVIVSAASIALTCGILICKGNTLSEVATGRRGK